MEIELTCHRRHVLANHIDACPIPLDPAVVDMANRFSKNPESVRTLEIAVVEEHFAGTIFHVGVGVYESRVFVVRIINEPAAIYIDSDAATEEKPMLERSPGAIHIDAVHGDIVDRPQGDACSSADHIRDDNSIPGPGKIVWLVAYALQSAIAILYDAVVDQQAADRVCHDRCLVAIGCPDIVYDQTVYGPAAIISAIDPITKAIL